MYDYYFYIDFGSPMFSGMPTDLDECAVDMHIKRQHNKKIAILDLSDSYFTENEIEILQDIGIAHIFTDKNVHIDDAFLMIYCEDCDEIKTIPIKFDVRSLNYFD